jgi:hypothetical protein
MDGDDETGAPAAKPGASKGLEAADRLVQKPDPPPGAYTRVASAKDFFYLTVKKSP